MFFASFTINGEHGGGIYYDRTDGPYCDGYSLYFRETFSPDTKHGAFIDFHIKGKTYAERKDSLYNIALDYVAAWSEYSFSYSELFAISEWMERKARRYGLLREFRENCIC